MNPTLKRLLATLIILPMLLGVRSLSAIKAQTPLDVASIEGIVVDSENGTPIAGATVSVKMPGGQPDLNATSDSTGLFLFENVPPERLSLDATKGGFVLKHYWSFNHPTVTLRPGEHLKDLTIKLTRTGAISGRVLNSEGGPVVGAQIQLLRYSYSTGEKQLGPVGAISSAGAMQTNDRGEFPIFDLPPDSYYIRINPLDRTNSRGLSQSQALFTPVLYPGTRDLARATAVDLRSGEELILSNVTITVGPAGWIHAHATNNTGEPTPDFIGYSLLPENWTGGQFLFVQRAPTGISPPTQDFRPEFPGVYEVSGGFRTANGYFEGRAKIEYTGDDANVNVTITKPDATLTGRVFETALTGGGSRPLPDLQLIIPSAPMIFTNSEGNFDAFGMYAGTYTLRRLAGLSANDYIASARQVDRDVLQSGIFISSGTTKLEIEVRPDGGMVSGKVAAGEGVSVSDSFVVLVPDSALLKSRSDLINFPFSTVDQMGTFEIQGIIPGNYRLYAWSDIERGVWHDPEFFKKFEEWGTAVRVERGSHQSIDLKTLNNSLVTPAK